MSERKARHGTETERQLMRRRELRAEGGDGHYITALEKTVEEQRKRISALERAQITDELREEISVCITRAHRYGEWRGLESMLMKVLAATEEQESGDESFSGL